MAILCPALQNVELEKCEKNPGGLKLKAYVFSSESRTSLTYNDATYTVDSVEYNDGIYPVLPVSITFSKNTANMAQSKAGVIETTNTTNMVTISITINNNQYLKSKAINIMGAGTRELDLAIQYNNNTNWFIPNAQLLQTDVNSGTLRADGSNYVLTFTAELDELAYGIEDAAFTQLITDGKITTP